MVEIYQSPKFPLLEPGQEVTVFLHDRGHFLLLVNEQPHRFVHNTHVLLRGKHLRLECRERTPVPGQIPDVEAVQAIYNMGEVLPIPIERNDVFTVVTVPEPA